MGEKACKLNDKEYCDLIFNIRQTTQIVQSQFEIMNDAVETCSQISEDSLMECIGAVNTAHGEILQFLALNVKLARLIDDFRNYITKKHM